VCRGALRAPSPPPVAVATAAAPAPVVRRRRSSGFLDSIFGPGGPNRAPQTSAAQFGSESIANGGKQAYPVPMDGDTIDEITTRLTNYDVSTGYLIVTLDNGQIWRQVSGEPVGPSAAARRQLCGDGVTRRRRRLQHEAQPLRPDLGGAQDSIEFPVVTHFESRSRQSQYGDRG